ncbi:MAG: hypothetical protein KDK70_00185 [Myxococcales bacterium]|nr:hypothetical protein [Myxococcales bacterium]
MRHSSTPPRRWLAIVWLAASASCDRADPTPTPSSAEGSGSAASAPAQPGGDAKTSSAPARPGGDAGTPGGPAPSAGDGKAPSTPPEVAEASGAPTAEAAKPPEEASPALPAPGWTRVELSSVVPEMTGTIDLPPGVTAAAALRSEMDADGLQTEARGVQLGPRVGGAMLEVLAVIPPRFESAAAMAAFHDRFEVVSTHEFGPGHWAVVHRWRPGECMLHGWSAAAGLTCDVFKAACDEAMDQWVRTCGSLRPGPAPNTSPTTPRSAFPSLDPAAAEVAITVARAIVRNDPSMLLGTLGPKGLRIKRKKYTVASLEAALTGHAVLQVVAPILYTPDLVPEEVFMWNGDAPKPDRERVWFTGGYGRQPYFELEKQDGAWHLTAFGVEDLGEP